MAKVSLPSLLKTMVEQGASDLHLSVGSPPQYRIHGKMIKVKMDPLLSKDTEELAYSVITDSQKAEFEKHLELDFSFGIKDLSRFRGNVFYQRGSIAAVFRRIPMVIPEFDSLKLPQILKSVIHRPNGLILVTGATGSGKSTSLASMLDILNREEVGHIITIEDPIEFIHPHKGCVVNQREVGVDTKGFASSLKRVLRQDPDFVLVGEMRDMETIESALTIAETGHLVFATLHTNTAVQAINRIVNVFPPHQQPQIRQSLSFTLQVVVSQQLISKNNGTGRVLACEVLIPTLGIRNLIREDKIHHIYSAMQSGQEETGMQTMNQALTSLVSQGVISKTTAIEHSFMQEELIKQLANMRG
ncbi:MAG: PilT/PilU family type 4a pilus ATPase [Bdellovibrionota bacterium]